MRVPVLNQEADVCAVDDAVFVQIKGTDDFDQRLFGPGHGKAVLACDWGDVSVGKGDVALACDNIA